jgi:bifunctional non-homologous end joining protein LigD
MRHNKRPARRAAIQPMLATLVEAAFDRPGWFFEVKWDGYRAIAEVADGRVALYSRNHQSFAERFAPLVQSLRKLGHDAVLDGEVVVVDERGRASFQLLQNYQKAGQGQLRYYVFDLLSLDGRDLRRLPLRRRKELLGKVLDGLPNVLPSEHVEECGKAFFAAVTAQGLEGIIAKDAESPYREGSRSPAWLKIKARRRQEAVIGGFTEPRGSRQHLGALVLGVYEDGELTYIGHTGGGLDAQGLSELRSRLGPLVQRACPFRRRPATNAPVHWVSPQLVCEVTFQEWTQDGRMRQPIFVGLREDKPPTAVRREKAEPVLQVRDGQSAGRPRRRGPATAASAARVTGPSFTNLHKVYWPKEGYTKGDLTAYYREVAPVLLPYLHDRPQALHRHPNGITGKSFFQKDVSPLLPPDWVATAALPSGLGGESITYVLCQDESTLLYLANLGCIELNPWHSRTTAPDRPDYLVIDLDPLDVPLSRVIDAALAVREALEDVGAACFCKTSGKRGLHVLAPLGARYEYGHARRFAEIVATLVHRHLPDSTSLVRRPGLRRGQVYLDFLQNARGKTLAAPYCVRPTPGATVSAPLAWQEVRKGLEPSTFTLRTMPHRLDKVGDLWQAVLGPAIDLEACLERLRKAHAPGSAL